MSGQITLALNQNISYSFAAANKSYNKSDIDSRIHSFGHLNFSTGCPISQGRDVSWMVGKNFFDWFQSGQQGDIKKAFTHRVIGLVKDLKAHPEFKEAVVKFAGEYSKYLDHALLKEAGLLPSTLTVALNPQIDYSFKNKEGDFQDKGRIDGHLKSFEHLNRETGLFISHGSDVTKMVGKSFFDWFEESQQEGDIKQAYTSRIIGLVKDLKANPEFQNTVVKFAGEYSKYLDHDLLSKADFSHKMAVSKPAVVFKGPVWGGSKPPQLGNWEQLEQNYHLFLKQMKENPVKTISKKMHLMSLANDSKELERVKKSWLKSHPGWKIESWGNQEVAELLKEIGTKFPKMGDAWIKAKTAAEKVDLLRYCILLKEKSFPYLEKGELSHRAIDDLAFTKFAIDQVPMFAYYLEATEA